MGAGYQSEGMTDYEEDVNWDEVGQVVAVGSYDGEIVEASYAQTKAGKHMVSAQFKILAADDPDLSNNEGRIIFENFVFTKEAAFRVKRLAKACELELPSPINKTILEEWAQSLVGTQVGFTVGHRMWQDEPRANIVKFHEFGTGGEADEAEPAKKPVATNGKANGHTNGVAPKATTKATTKSKAEEPEEEEDENESDSDENEAEEPQRPTSVKDAVAAKKGTTGKRK